MRPLVALSKNVSFDVMLYLKKQEEEDRQTDNSLRKQNAPDVRQSTSADACGRETRCEYCSHCSWCFTVKQID